MIEPRLKVRSQSPMFGHWAKTAKQFLVAYILGWRLKVAFIYESDPELAYMSFTALGTLDIYLAFGGFFGLRVLFQVGLSRVEVVRVLVDLGLFSIPI